MKYTENFKFLNIQVVKKRNASELEENERNFLIINLLDENMNPCKFLVFDKEIIVKALNSHYLGLQDLEISFELLFSNDNWHVKLIDINE